MMIDEVSRPFIDLNDDNDAKEAQSWMINEDYYNNLNNFVDKVQLLYHID